MPNREYERTKPESAKQENVTHSAEEEALMRAFRRGDDNQTIPAFFNRDRRKFCVIDEPRQYENHRLSQE